MDIQTTLNERGSRYGEFIDNSTIAQEIKTIMRQSIKWEQLPADHKEALDQTATKISRWLTGDFTYKDNPHDIVGYMTKVLERMR